jgi:hypothetical protein
MQIHDYLRICLSFTLLLFSVQLQSLAQAEPFQPSSPFNQSILVDPQHSIPNLPPIRPTFPDPVEAAIRLVLSRGDRRVFIYRGNV